MAAKWCIGLMTGTVMDGNIDIAMIKTDGLTIEEFGPYTLAEYDEHTRDVIARAMQSAQDWNFEGPEPEIFREAEIELSNAQARAINAFVSNQRTVQRKTDASHPGSNEPIEIVGFHGQTVLHRAPEPSRIGATRQLGDGQIMADLIEIPVVFDFRSEDIALGGQGAPLAAIYHQALLRSSQAIDNKEDTAILNLGGVGNISWWDGENTLIAFDTGPANAPINDWISNHGHGDMDRDGLIAKRGQVDEARLSALLDHPYFKEAYPKSLDRNSFTKAMANGLSLEDGAALLTAFSAAAVGKALDNLPRRPKQLVACGGGRRNPRLLAEIEKRAGVQVKQAEDLGWRGDAVEAECFAFLAARRMAGLPISFPGTTGVPAPLSGGRIAYPASKPG